MIYYLGESPELAKGSLDRAIQLDPELAVAHLYRGLVLAQSDQSQQAAADLLQALSLGLDTDTANYELGVALVSLGQRPKGLLALNRAIELNPAFADAYRTRGAGLTPLSTARALTRR